MKTNKTKYSQIALIIAAVAAVASLVFTIIYSGFTLASQICLGVGVVALAVSILLDPEDMRAFFSRRQAKYGTNMLLSTLAVLAILVVVNLIGYHNDIRWDLTADKTNSLSPETLNVLKSLDQPVTAQAYFTSLTSKENAETLLRNYSNAARGKFSYEFIDPNENPLAANEAGITRDGSIVLKAGDAKEIITTVNEQQLTSALLRLLSPEEKVIYVLTGHGEPTFDAYEDASYAYAVRELTTKNYTINELNLLATNTIPEDAKVIIIAGPQKPLSEDEVTLLKAFVDNGGGLIVMLEPTALTQFGDSQDPLATWLADEWNIQYEDDLIIDLTSQSGTLAVVEHYGNHAITTSLTGMTAVFPTCRSLNTGTDSSITPTALAYSSANAWGETDMEALLNNSATYDADSDHAGPLALALAVEDSITGSRIVAFGDSEFANNAMYQYYGNADLFLNSVDWVAKQDQLINLTAKSTTERTLVTPNKAVQNAILFGSVAVIPLAIIIAGVVVGIRRRKEI